MDPSDDPLEQQQQLAETSLPLLFQTYDDALAEQVDRPVLVLLDCEDDIGGAIARGWLGDEAVDDAIAYTDDESETTVFARAVAWEASCSEIPKFFPYLASVFAQGPPVDGFLVISVTSGGASALTVPLDARE